MQTGNMPRNLLQKWQWSLEINGIDSALFTKGQEPKTEFEEVAFAPAGSMYDHKLAGRVTFDDLTFEKGIVAEGLDNEALRWIQSQMEVLTSTGAPPAAYMRNVDIVRHNRMGIEIRRWTLFGAWVKSLEYEDLEGSSDNSLEKITLCYQFWMKR